MSCLYDCNFISNNLVTHSISYDSRLSNLLSNLKQIIDTLRPSLPILELTVPGVFVIFQRRWLSDVELYGVMFPELGFLWEEATA
jgi:hypothetical protein